MLTAEEYRRYARANRFLNKPALAADYYKKAIASLGDYVRDNPNDPDGFYLLGNAHTSISESEKAIEAYKKSLELSPNFMKAHYNLGSLYAISKQSKAANQEYEILLMLDKNYAQKLKATMDDNKN